MGVPDSRFGGVIQEFFGRMDNIKLAGLQVVFSRVDKGLGVRGGKEALETFPHWAQNILHKLVDTHFRPLAQSARSWLVDKNPESLGKFAGIAKRTGEAFVHEVFDGYGVMGKEIKEQSEKLGDALGDSGVDFLDELFEIVESRFEAIGLEPAGDKSSELDFLEDLKEVEGGLYSAEYKSIRQVAAKGRFNPEQWARFHDGERAGYNSFLNTEGWFTRDRGKSGSMGRLRVYGALLLYEKEIEELIRSPEPFTLKDLQDRLEDWIGADLNPDIKALAALCREIGLKLHSVGRPRRSA